jgi:hypothetical protein
MRAAKDSEKRIDRAAEAARDGEKLITMSSDLMRYFNSLSYQ